MKVTTAQIMAIGGKRTNRAIAAGVAKGINEYGSVVHLDTVARIAEFLGQCSVESGGFRILKESLNYSTTGVRKTFGKHRISTADCNRYGRKGSRKANQKAIADCVYGGSWGAKNLGNVYAGDGSRYIGRGVKQVTGRANCRNCTVWMRKKFPGCPNFVDHPEMLQEFPWAFLSAAWFWSSRQVYMYADRNNTKGATKTINGGYNGLPQRIAAVKKAKRILGAKDVSVQTSRPRKLPDPQLKEYQRKLNDIAKATNDSAFHAGKADGWHGKKTAAAVIASQKMSKSLWDAAVKAKAEGKLGPKTRANIDRLHAKFVKPAPVQSTAPVQAAPAPKVTKAPLAPPKPPASKPEPKKKKGWWPFR